MNENDPFEKQDMKVDETRDAKGQFVEGNPGGKLKKGAANKFTDLKKVFLAVFEKIESEAELKKEINSFYAWVIKNEKNQGLFYQMLSKMLPRNVDVGLTGDTTIRVVSALPRPVENKPKLGEEK